MSKACKQKYTSVGGQALMEGIMMRGPERTVVSCRRPDGSIVSQDMPDSTAPASRILRLPIIRGSVNFVRSLITGYKALMLSVELSEALVEPETEPSQAEASVDPELYGDDDPLVQDAAEREQTSDKDNLPKQDKKQTWVMTLVGAVSAVLGVAVAVLLMFVLPTKLFDLINMLCAGNIEWLRVPVESFIKIAIFVAYLAAVSLMKEIHRVFEYHGAEHKSIFCYEKGLPLTVENVREQSRFHPRCGTSFMILMLIVSLVFYSLLVWIAPWLADNTYIWVALKILLLPLICGFGYELIRMCGKHDNTFTRIISAPGVWLQHLTTKEPDDSMIEVAITALTQVIPEDRSDIV